MTLAAQAFARAFPGLGVEEVLALREGRDWRHFPANDPSRFSSLLSVADLDAHLRTDGARSRVSMADEARPGSAGVPEDERVEDAGLDAEEEPIVAMAEAAGARHAA